MPIAKLTLEQARELRKLKSSMTYSQLAALFGIKRATACRIVKGYSYREPGTPRKFQRREATLETATCRNCHKAFKYWCRPADPPRQFCNQRCNLIFQNLKNRKVPDAAILATLYHLKRWSLKRIAIHYGCCHQAIHVAMKKAGIKRRTNVEGTRNKARINLG